MPKRKRGHYVAKELDPAREAELKRESVAKTVIKARRILNRALRTAKGFERQKLGKRIKISAEKQDEDKCKRLLVELEALKSLDLSIVVESHLRKSLLKSKSISESALLPQKLKEDLLKKSTTLSDSSAINNVIARMFNMKHVKEATAQVMDSLYSTLGILNSTPASKMNTRVTHSLPRHSDNEEEQSTRHSTPVEQGAKSKREANVIEDGVESPREELGPECESKLQFATSSHDDKLIGGSSNEDIYENAGEEGTGKLVSLEENIRRITRDPSISLSDISRSPSPLKHGKKFRMQVQLPKSGSTFLPTLMGGYWSGSESATDDEDAPAPRKNRPGQQARRAMWEKIYGAKASHLKGQVLTGLSDKDWDPKRGARSLDDRGRRGGGGGIIAGRSRFTKGKDPATGDIAVGVTLRARGMGKKDDEGPLHPSWEAAKKAKAAKQTVEFQGKKVVFD